MEGRVEIDGNSFSLQGAAANSAFTMTGVIDGNVMTGENDVTGVGVFAMEATRQVE